MAQSAIAILVHVGEYVAMLSNVTRRRLVATLLLAASALAVPSCGSGRSPEEREILAVPETERIVLPTLRDEVHVVRTESHIPHIYARNERDLRVVQGYIAAVDRYFAIEAGRRLGWGELSEWIGDAALAADQQARGQGISLVAQRIYDQLTPEHLDLYEAYAEGINAYIDAVERGDLLFPTELRLARSFITLEHVTARDLVGWLAAVTYQQGWDNLDVARARVEDQLADAYTGSGAANESLRAAGLTQDIWAPVEPLTQVSTTPGFGLTGSPTMSTNASTAGLVGGRSLMPNQRPSVPSELLDRALARAERFQDAFHGGSDQDFGSNVWAMTASATEDGAALLAGDGHLPLSVPSLLYHTGLDTSVFGSRDGLRQLGLFFAGVPFMGVGTNGNVAYSITYLYGDLTDWYREEIQLDANGAPTHSRFRGEWQPLVATTETYEIADVPVLGSVARTETWDRYATFDGRLLAEIEGDVVTADYVPASGETVINVQGEYIVPKDTDGDDIVTAITFDYSGLDIANTVQAADELGRAESVSEMREASRRFVGFGQNVGAADIHGDVWYGSYNALPCRENLRNPDRTWADGGDPRSLLDGTQYGAFEIPLNDEGLPDETDTENCLIPFEQWPMAISPTEGFIQNANNDVAGTTLDGDLENDDYYLGYDYALGYRAQTISNRLRDLASSQAGSLEAMRELQAEHHSPVGRQLAPLAVEALTTARTLSETDGPLTPEEQRLVDLYNADASRYDDIVTRLNAWLARGAQAESGVETFYDSPTATEREDAVATMIWNEWLRGMLDTIFGDEPIDFVWGPDASLRVKALVRVLMGRGAGNPGNLASWDSATEESAFFDVVSTAEVERSEEMIVDGLAQALARLEAAPDPDLPDVGGFGTTDMSQWLWGMRHMVRFESLVKQFAGDVSGVEVFGRSIDTNYISLAPDLPDTDPRKDLRWFPRHSDLYSVDAAHPPLFSGRDYTFGNGPVMRMVFRMEPGNVTGVNILPGGQQGSWRSEFFADQARMWLANDVLPARFEVRDVVAGAVGREVYGPR